MEDAYYRDASSADAFLAVKIPIFAVHAKDDPVCHLFPECPWTVLILGCKVAVDEAVPYLAFDRNQNSVICSTSRGGHLGWFELSGGRWFAKPVE